MVETLLSIVALTISLWPLALVFVVIATYLNTKDTFKYYYELKMRLDELIQDNRVLHEEIEHLKRNSNFSKGTLDNDRLDDPTI